MKRLLGPLVGFLLGAVVGGVVVGQVLPGQVRSILVEHRDMELRRLGEGRIELVPR